MIHGVDINDHSRRLRCFTPVKSSNFVRVRKKSHAKIITNAISPQFRADEALGKGFICLPFALEILRVVSKSQDEIILEELKECQP